MTPVESLRQLREHRSLSLKELAARSSLANHSVLHLKQGEGEQPSWKTIRVLAGALDVQPDQLARVLRKE